MTALREAVVLPALFLTATLAAGLRPGGAATLEAPSLFALVLATLLFAALMQSGVVAPERLVSDTRGTLPNLNGLAVLATAFAASAQVFTLVTPAAGLPALVVATFLLIALLHTLTVAPDRIHMLRGLTVLLGAAFLIKFIVLAALSSPSDGRIARALQIFFDGVTLGAITQPPLAPLNGYLGFAALALYFAGLLLLPAAGWKTVRISDLGIADRRLIVDRRSDD